MSQEDLVRAANQTGLSDTGNCPFKIVACDPQRSIPWPEVISWPFRVRVVPASASAVAVTDTDTDTDVVSKGTRAVYSLVLLSNDVPAVLAGFLPFRVQDRILLLMQ